MLRPFFDDFQKRLGTIGICSFAGQIMNPLMWAHYTDSHKGVCLLYHFPGSFVTEERNNFIGLTDVEYGTNALTEWFKSVALKLPNMEFETFRNELLFKIIAIKDNCWEYEKEGRLIKNGSGVFPIDRNYLVQIIFGMNSSADDMKMLRILLSDCGYSRITIGKIVKGNNDCELSAEEISPGLV